MFPRYPKPPPKMFALQHADRYQPRRYNTQEALDLSIDEAINTQASKQPTKQEILARSIEILLDRVASEMLKVAGDAGVTAQAMPLLANQDAFLKEARAFCEAEPRYSELLDRLYAELGAEFSYGLSGEYLTFFENLRDRLKEIPKEDIPIRLRMIKEA